MRRWILFGGFDNAGLIDVGFGDDDSRGDDPVVERGGYLG